MEAISQYGDMEVAKRNIPWLIKLNELAAGHNTQLIFFYAPRASQVREDIIKYTKEALKAQGIQIMYNFNLHFEEMGLDIKTDFMDPLHLNTTGAEKFSIYLSEQINGDILKGR